MTAEKRKDDNYMNEPMDMRRFFLCLFGKAWIMVLVTAICAILGALIYTMYYEITDGETRYQRSVDFYITFNEADYPNGMDYYNAYTWNQFVTDDRIVNKVLSVAGGKVSEYDIRDYVTARMMSDYRVLTVVVTGTVSSRINTICEAYKVAMPMFAEDVNEISKIEPWSEDDIIEVVDHTLAKNAALLGGIIGLFVSLVFWAVYYCMNDRIYTEADWCRRFPDIPITGYDCDIFGNENSETSNNTEPDNEAVLSIPWGEHATAVEYMLNDLKNKGTLPQSVRLINCDRKFLKRYYGRTAK